MVGGSVGKQKVAGGSVGWCLVVLIKPFCIMSYVVLCLKNKVLLAIIIDS